MDQDQPTQLQTVSKRSGRIEAPEAPANALTLVLAGRNSPKEPTLSLFGYYNIDVATAGRYGSVLPGAAYVVLVERESGEARVRDLANEDDVPASYAADGEPSITRADAPANTSGMSESGHFTVNLSSHLGLPADPGVYDGFLWLEDILSDMASVAKPGDDEPVRAGRNAPPSSDRLVEIAMTGEADTLRVHARVDGGPVSIIAMTPVSRGIGSATFASGADASALVSEIITSVTPGERVLAVAVSNGTRSVLIDSAQPN